MSDSLHIIYLNEHHNGYAGFDATECLAAICPPIQFKKIKESLCINCIATSDKRILYSSYYVGTDWLEENKTAVYVEPKLNDGEKQVDILKMLVDSMSNADTAAYVPDMFELKTEKPYITLPHQQDFITPILIFQFLAVVKQIVRKGLKKSYYAKTENLYSRVKGKVLVSKTIKNNLVKNKQLHTQCMFDEFGVDSSENRVLKKALNFAQQYLETLVAGKQNSDFNLFVTNTYNYISPAFRFVSDTANPELLKHVKLNPFFKEYREGLHLAKLILKRYGYNINNVRKEEEVSVPPFWIDMSKLFELYVLAHLRKLYKREEVTYQFHGKYGYPDFLIITHNERIIADAKYKPRYTENGYDINDIRQMSGYARDIKVVAAIGIAEADRLSIVPECLIIYSNQESKRENLSDISDKEQIKQFVNFKKIEIKLPEISS